MGCGTRLFDPWRALDGKVDPTFRLRTCTPGVFGSPSWASKTPPVVETVNKLPSGTGVPSLDKISVEIRSSLLSSARLVGRGGGLERQALADATPGVAALQRSLTHQPYLTAGRRRFCPLQRISPGTQTTDLGRRCGTSRCTAGCPSRRCHLERRSARALKAHGAWRTHRMRRCRRVRQACSGAKPARPHRRARHWRPSSAARPARRPCSAPRRAWSADVALLGKAGAVVRADLGLCRRSCGRPVGTRCAAGAAAPVALALGSKSPSCCRSRACRCCSAGPHGSLRRHRRRRPRRAALAGLTAQPGAPIRCASLDVVSAAAQRCLQTDSRHRPWQP